MYKHIQKCSNALIFIEEVRALLKFRNHCCKLYSACVCLTTIKQSTVK